MTHLKIIVLYIVIFRFMDSKSEDICFIYTKPESKQWKQTCCKQ